MNHPDYSDRMVRAFDHFGIDPDRSDARIDLEEARRAEMEAIGIETRRCVTCRSAYPAAISKAALCPTCKRRSDARDAARGPIRTRPGGFRFGASTRVPDGLGDSERVPSWTLRWEER